MAEVLPRGVASHNPGVPKRFQRRAESPAAGGLALPHLPDQPGEERNAPRLRCKFDLLCPGGLIEEAKHKEGSKEELKVVLGMFDPSARPCVPLDVLTMAFPMKKFEKVVGYMEESFLITKEWPRVEKKIERSRALYRKK